MDESSFLESVFINQNVSTDHRGKLSAVEFEGLPFTPKRIFFISEISKDSIRGQHAHRICEQIIYVISGSCEIATFSRSQDFTLNLDSNSPGIYLPVLTWCEISKLADSTILAVLASHPYDVDDYITDFDEFTRAIKQ